MARPRDGVRLRYQGECGLTIRVKDEHMRATRPGRKHRRIVREGIRVSDRAGLLRTRSRLSILSLGSLGSILGIGSILSIGSAGSILSIGSAGSILRRGKEEPEEDEA